ALDLRDALLERIHAHVVLLAILVERDLELVDAVIDCGDETVRAADVLAELVDIGAEIRAVAFQELRRFLEHRLELRDLRVELLLFRAARGLDLVDVFAHRIPFALGRDPEATGEREPCEYNYGLAGSPNFLHF